MDLDAIPTAEFALGEAILPPGHYGTDEPEPVVFDVITTDNSTGKRSSDDPYQPVCDTCGGDRYVNIYVGRTTQRHPCPDCAMRGMA